MSKKHEKENKVKEENSEKTEPEMIEVQPQSYLEEWKKERAGFLNYKAEESERIERAIKFANEGFLANIIAVLDTIYLAEENLPEELKDNEWAKGTLQIKDQILDFLKSNGVEEINCLNQDFDPNFHEAIDIVDNGSKSGTVTEEIKKGYVLNGKLIRPSMVRVAK